jgi:hypothetical protein
VSCFPVALINMRDEPDPYLTSMCSIVKNVILSDVHKKDLELISEIISYTFGCNKISSKREGKNDNEKSVFASASTVSNSVNSHRIGEIIKRRHSNTVDEIELINISKIEIPGDNIQDETDKPQPDSQVDSLLFF